MRLPRRLRRLLLLLVAVTSLACGAAVAWLYSHAGMYGVNVLLQRGGSFWSPVEPTSSSMSPSMRLALREDVPVPAADPVEWRDVIPGLAVAELAVRVGDTEVDRILLTRIDTSRFRFIVRSAPAGNLGLQDWMRELGAVVVVNGSYYDRRGAPDTPLVTDGVLLGPTSYEARHGAFVATAASAGLVDLGRSAWREALAGASDGFVSYPLLLARDGTSRAQADRQWLANRSFVGEDLEGRIVIGTTRDAFFSLTRLADFLRTGPLRLSMALNLDGGPVACQGVAAGTYCRDVCGLWETKTEAGQLLLLRWPLWWRRFSLPIVLAAVPR